jgi:hypothetical protein
MLYQWLRLINGSDISLANQDDSQKIDFNLQVGDYVYLGQYFPFNNFFAWVDTANEDAAALSIEYWANNKWVSAVDVLDGTSVDGATLGKSGVVQFSPLKLSDTWSRVSDTSESNSTTPVELNSFAVYDCFWVRLKVDSNLSAGTKLNKITYTFTDSQQLNKYDVEINGFMPAFETGKADWIKEVVTASEIMLSDLKSKGLVISRGQILRFDDVSMACDLKTLALIYSNLGKAYEEKRIRKELEYEKAINLRRFTFDLNNNGMVDEGEIQFKTVRIVR